MARSPESRPGISQLVSNVGEFVARRPFATAGAVIFTAVTLHAGAIGHEAWSEAGPDVERKAEGQRSGRIIVGESTEHIAKRSVVYDRRAGETNVDLAGIVVGTTLLLVDFMLPPRRRRSNLPLAVV